MKCFFALVVPLVLLLSILSSSNARKDVGEYWRGVMEDKPMPEAIQKILQAADEKANCHTTKNFEPNRPDVSIYHNDQYLKEGKPFDKKFTLNDFEPRPDVSIYHDDVGLKGEIEMPLKEKSFFKDLELIPDVSIYHNDISLKAKKPLDETSFVKEFEPRPDVSIYHNDIHA
ncbi:organ-specific protein P4-like [Hevea brasiliensis]|uniref:organ-specific protein P4-like n=1 Tax=Hevea brasiliensis TaxID=3981 RepID=UPI0025CDF8BC|nr:organ-specific protein P4-like [Hevea brasiliensis]